MTASEILAKHHGCQWNVVDFDTIKPNKHIVSASTLIPCFFPFQFWRWKWIGWGRPRSHGRLQSWLGPSSATASRVLPLQVWFGLRHVAKVQLQKFINHQWSRVSDYHFALSTRHFLRKIGTAWHLQNRRLYIRQEMQIPFIWIQRGGIEQMPTFVTFGLHEFRWYSNNNPMFISVLFLVCKISMFSSNPSNFTRDVSVGRIWGLKSKAQL